MCSHALVRYTCYVGNCTGRGVSIWPPPWTARVTAAIQRAHEEPRHARRRERGSNPRDRRPQSMRHTTRVHDWPNPGKKPWSTNTLSDPASASLLTCRQACKLPLIATHQFFDSLHAPPAPAPPTLRSQSGLPSLNTPHYCPERRPQNGELHQHPLPKSKIPRPIGTDLNLTVRLGSQRNPHQL